ncbi:ATP-binding cassette subfamily C protein CydCD [Kitasatospora sp. GP30]|uniref:thiol reductant ABC exporter subunit CydD n=1 Tax=Kitasatospora sp. GP30 TaxID=3035084 RepID=UPI000C70E5FB|nr:thiol reductant ABC exporter subunit CydD [Kitasatospora sp. GP30]MDH6141511.1 ATP-binding cassette subfamily C protein CydCD [Kitasatospora sp. GP30]
MKPVDPRLLAEARAARLFMAATVLLGAVGAALTLAQATLIAEIVVRCFQHGQDVRALALPLGLLALVALGRAGVAWLTELAAHRSVARVKSRLRGRLVEHATALGPAYLAGRRTGELVTLATRGIDALDDYFARYLPQLALAVVAPAVLLARILGADWVSAAIIVGTLPLIPLFMVLIGWATQGRMDRQWRSLARLSHHFLDVVAGLPTLKVFGRAKAQAAAVRKITDDYRQATLRTLRLAFVSSFALELLATISVALVAVSIGFRLVDGSMDLETGLLVLILAPEVYLPLRQVGALYHASAEGLAAAGEVFAVLETPLPSAGAVPAPSLEGASLVIDGVTVCYPGRVEPAVDGADFSVAAGRTVALTGPSGAGKSTLLAVLLGFVAPSAGAVTVVAADGRAYPLGSLDLASWRAQIAWVPQRPHLFAGTVAENVRLARPEASDAQVADALRAVGALGFAAPDTVLGEGGTGLSAGQRQRLALARALLADRPLVLLDEPTANLDAESEAAVVDAVRALAADPRRTVLLVAHRPALLALAEERVAVGGAPVAAVAVHAAVGAASPVPPTPSEPASGAPLPSSGTPLPASGTPLPSSGTPLRRLSRLFRTAEAGRPRRRFWLAVLLGSLALGCAIALLATSGWLISRASQHPPVLYLMMAVTSVRAFGVGRGFFRYAERLVSHDAVLRTLGSLRVTVYQRLERLAPAALPAFRRGDLLSRLVADVDSVQDWYLRWRLPACVAGVVSVLVSVGLGLLVPAAGVVLALGLLLTGVAVPLLAARSSSLTERQQSPARGTLATAVVDTCTGTAELTVAGALPSRLAAVRAADARLTRLAARSAGTTALGAGLTALLTGLTVAGCAAVGVQAVAGGHLSGLFLAVVILTPLAAFEAVAGLPAAVQVRERSRAAAERLTDVLDTPDPVVEPAYPALPPADPFPLAVRGLRAQYPGQQGHALDGVDLDIAAGQRIAVVGPSGSGKTTLAQVLLRLLDPTSGSVTLAAACPQAVDSRTLDGDAVRRLIGLCAQGAHVFDSSLRENLRLARPDATDADLRAALASARLLDWVTTLPQDLDTMVGEHGARLSGGQRQRLALARALLADFPLLILDEPAEHLDLPTADALMADLLAATEDRATLLITHRLAPLATADVDEILVLADGRVAERGSWGELMARQDGRLRGLWELETMGERALAA